MISKSHVYAPKSNIVKPNRPVVETKSSPFFDVMETLMETFKISIDDEITVTSPVKVSTYPLVDDLRYERDFLLRFQEACKEPIDGLISEVLPGFVHPEPYMESNSKPAKSIAPKFNAKSTIAISSNQPEVAADPSTVGSSSVAPKDRRVKKVKKQKPREQDARRLIARQKQIDIGMNTPGYVKFNEAVPLSARTKAHPKIPDIYQVCSKRSWDGQVRKWRRQLHDFDPSPEAAGQDGLTQNAAERGTSNHSSEDECSSDDEDDEVDV